MCSVSIRVTLPLLGTVYFLFNYYPRRSPVFGPYFVKSGMNKSVASITVNSKNNLWVNNTSKRIYTAEQPWPTLENIRIQPHWRSMVGDCKFVKHKAKTCTMFPSQVRSVFLSLFALSPQSHFMLKKQPVGLEVTPFFPFEISQ